MGTRVIGVGRPSPDDLRTLLDLQADEPFAYAPVGMVRAGGAGGFRHHRDTLRIGTGSGDFDRAVGQLAGWVPQRGAGLTVVADGPVAEGTDVVLVFPLPVVSVTVACRVAYVIDEADRWGYGYGTLSHHPERGEELFLVSRDADDAVWFTIETLSRWGHPLARLGAPVSRLLQRLITRRYLAALVQPTYEAPAPDDPSVRTEEWRRHG